MKFSPSGVTSNLPCYTYDLHPQKPPITTKFCRTRPFPSFHISKNRLFPTRPPIIKQHRLNFSNPHVFQRWRPLLPLTSCRRPNGGCRTIAFQRFKNLSDHFMLVDKTDKLHLLRTFRAGQRVNVPYLLNAGPPQQVRDTSGLIYLDFSYLVTCTLPAAVFFAQLLPPLSVTAHSIALPAIAANQLKRLLRLLAAH